MDISKVTGRYSFFYITHLKATEGLIPTILLSHDPTCTMYDILN